MKTSQVIGFDMHSTTISSCGWNKKSCWKSKRELLQGFWKNVFTHVTLIPFNVFYMFKAMWIFSLFTGNPQEHRCSKIYSQWGGTENTQQKKATYSYFWYLSQIDKGTYLYTNV